MDVIYRWQTLWRSKDMDQFCKWLKLASTCVKKKPLKSWQLKVEVLENVTI